MSYYDNEQRIGRRAKQAKRLLDNFEASMMRCNQAVRYARQDYDKPVEEGS